MTKILDVRLTNNLHGKEEEIDCVNMEVGRRKVERRTSLKFFKFSVSDRLSGNCRVFYFNFDRTRIMKIKVGNWVINFSTI